MLISKSLIELLDISQVDFLQKLMISIHVSLLMFSVQNTCPEMVGKEVLLNHRINRKVLTNLNHDQMMEASRENTFFSWMKQ